MKIEVNNINELSKVVECIKKSGKNIIILSGTLGSGKTTLVKEFVRELNVNATSPTFSIQNIYDDKIFHYDLYNKGVDEFLSLGMLEELEKDGYHFIEWGEGLIEMLDLYGFDYLLVKIEIKNNKRLFECQNL